MCQYEQNEQYHVRREGGGIRVTHNRHERCNRSSRCAKQTEAVWRAIVMLSVVAMPAQV
jgi:hypothetical protein